jgi:RND family efflux transporter MFP subunit
MNTQTVKEENPNSHQDQNKENRMDAGRPSKTWRNVGFFIFVLVSAVIAYHFLARSSAVAPSAQPPSVTVSTPLQRDLETRLQFLGQFAAVEHVELRAQVGGTLSEIHFKDGDIVNKGDLLLTIDPTPYEIKLSQANAQLESAKARLELANQESERAKVLKKTEAGSAQNVEQRIAEQLAAEASVNEVKAMIRDAQFDLDHCRITAPFSGRIGTHMVSVGNLIYGSRAGSNPTTLLATLVSLDPVYLNFDMSEQDYLNFSRQRGSKKEPLAEKVFVSLSDEKTFTHEGTLDFVDNVIDRASGTIHARATISNKDILLTPGAFGRVRFAALSPAPVLLVPDVSVMADLADHAVLIVGEDNVVKQKKVEVGALRGGLRVIRSGLNATDKVIVQGIMMATPGSKVAPTDGKIEFANDQD